MDCLPWILLGYVVGSFPTGYVLARLKGIDITKVGSGNIGGANVYRVLGAPYAFLTAVGDFLKGFLPTYFAPGLFCSVLAGAAALVGSIASIFLMGRGGKGFAALAGIWTALMALTGTWFLLPILLVLWLGTVVYSRYTSLANLLTVLTLIPLTAVAHSPLLTAFAVFSALLIFYSHRANVKRLLEGKEHSFLERVSGNVKW